MLSELILFAASFLVGAIGFVFLSALFFLNKKLNNRISAICLEFLGAGIVVSAFFFVLFLLNDGKFAFFALCSAMLGLIVFWWIFSAVSKAVKKRQGGQKFRSRQHSDKNFII
ncbi:MAG: hypothetical protein FWD86_02575 [Firmicutes bacterium]|nr:hypothetical protein [Bacillota bacterium]